MKTIDLFVTKSLKATFRFMTIDEVLHLSYGTHVWFVSNDHVARQAKVNGKVRTWKRDSDRIEVLLKYGLYEYATFDKHEALSRLLIPVNPQP